MKYESLSLWNDFKKAFIESIRLTDLSMLEKAWEKRGGRTLFYMTHLIPGIAKQLDLNFNQEKPFRIDGIFWKEAGQSSPIPVIYLESENDYRSSNEEVQKLCCLNAPLKILMVCMDWSNESNREKIINEFWGYTVEDFNEEIGLSGYLAIIIADGGETIKFYSCVFDNKAQIIEKNILAEKE